MIANIAFLNPWILAALVALPLIWLILRLTPPRPRRISFPPTLLLLSLEERETTPFKTPWWLTLIRMLLLAALIVALAEPVFRPEARMTNGEGPLTLVFDNGWDTAPTFETRVETAQGLLEEAKRDGRTVRLIATAEPQTGGLPPVSASEALNRLAVIAPRPYLPDHSNVASTLEGHLDPQNMEVVWIAGAIDQGGGSRLADVLGAGSSEASMIASDAPTRFLYPPVNAADGIEIRVGGLGGTGPASLVGFDTKGRRILQADVEIGEDLSGSATIDLPVGLRNALARMALAGVPSTGGVQLLDSRWRRKSVGLIAGEFGDAAQPLLAPLTYVQSALAGRSDILAPAEETLAQSINALIQRGASVIILSDTGSLPPQSLESVTAWIESGGTLVRFASPRLTGAQAELLPVPLRDGERALGGSLSWEEPRPIGTFDSEGPFGQIDVPGDVRITRQILADPRGMASAEVWADLNDGTPLVTARSQGEGRIVLFHVTADPRWSNLPLSGAFVEMLDAIVRSARSIGDGASAGPAGVTDADGGRTSVAASGTGGEDRASGTRSLPWTPVQSLDGFGALVSPSPEANLINNLDNASPSVETPPGYYERAGTVRALNAVSDDTDFAPLSETAIGWGGSRRSLEPRQSQPLWPWAFGLAALLALVDGLAILALAGRLLPARLAGAATAGLVAVLLGAVPDPGLAQASGDGDISPEMTEKALQATLKTRLAYVLTGNPVLDETSRAGLSGLTAYLATRTAMEPGEPIGVDIATDELAFYPFLYWPMDVDNEIPNADVMAKVDAFMKNGGTILFDTRDAGGAVSLGVSGASEGTEKLRTVLSFIDVPPLEPVPPDHVLTKAFYLLNHFPGRWEDSELWVESLSEGPIDPDRPARGGDGVSPIIITGNDFASAWAVGADGRYLYPTVPATARQREMALRSGVNIVMYTMTGNYKADQVHVPALLERLGQ